MPGGSNYLDRVPVFDPPPGKIVIEITQTEETYGKIIIPATSRETRVLGTVHTVFRAGEDDQGVMWEPWCKVGDLVIIGKYTGTDVRIARKQFVILMEKDILSRLSFKDAHEVPTSEP